MFADGIKQIVLTPENDDEKYALSLISPSDDISLLVTNGSVYGTRPHGPKPFTATVNESRGGYLRIYDDPHSRILVLKPKGPEGSDK